MSEEVDNLSNLVYAGLGIALLLIVALATATGFLFWKVHKLSKSSSSNGNKAEEENKDLGLQLVNQRFQIPKPNLVKGNNDPPSKFGDENMLSGMRFKHDRDERRSNNISLQGSAFKNQFSGHNDSDAISDSNFSFTRANQDDLRNNRSQEERRSNMGMQGNSRQNDYDASDHFSFTSQSGPPNELRNKRDQEERRAVGLNMNRGSFRNPLSAQNDFDSFDDNRGPFPLQRNMQRNIHY